MLSAYVTGAGVGAVDGPATCVGGGCAEVIVGCICAGGGGVGNFTCAAVGSAGGGGAVGGAVGCAVGCG